MVNLAIILLVLLTPIVEWTSWSGGYPWSMKYYAVLISLSVTFCLSFLGLNLYRVIKGQPHRNRYLWTAILMLVWVVCGVYQLVCAHMHDLVL
jgi:hypothetical protein